MMARALIALAILSGLLIVPAWVAQPSPMFVGFVPWPVPLLPMAGIVSYFIGLGWMVRIYRASANPEPDARSWRYRDL